MYIIDKSFVYQIEKTEHYEIKAGIGPVKRLELISEDETVKNYELQQFSLEGGKYIIDEDYSETVEIDGKEYKADRGKIIVPKELSESKAKIKELKEELKKKDDENKIALAEVFEENQKLKEHINEANLAIAELYENSIGKNA